MDRICQNHSEVGYVIVSFFSGETLVNHLSELAKSLEIQVHLVVVDNSGSEEEFMKLDSTLPKGICLLRGDGELGYASGNNLGLAHCFAKGSRFAFVANPDTEPNPQAIDACVSSMGENGDIGIVAPTIITETGRERFTKYFLGSEKHNSETIETREEKRFVDFVEGSFFLVRKEAFEEAKGIPTDFFMYHEDMAFCHAVRNANWYVQHLQGHHLVHYTNSFRRNIPAYAYYMTRNIWILGRFMGYEGETLISFTEDWNRDFVESMKSTFKDTGLENQILPALDLGWRDGEKGLTGANPSLRFLTLDISQKAEQISNFDPYDMENLVNLIREAFPEPLPKENWSSYYLKKRISRLETDLMRKSLDREMDAAPGGALIRIALRLGNSRTYQRIMKLPNVSKIKNWIMLWMKI